MISRLIEAEVVEDGEARRLDDIEITGFATMLGGAGAETVTKLVGNAVVVFADNPDQWQKLQGRPRQDTRGVRGTAAVRRAVAVSDPDHHTRCHVARHDDSAGDPVLLINGSASRDERFFPDADRFDIDRERKVGYNLNFGYGVHSCLGAALARMEGRIALETLIDLIPSYDVDRSGLQRVHMTNVLGWANVPVRAV